MNTNLSIDDMTKAGLQFGHKKSRVHPRVKPYLFGVRNTVFIIDLEKIKDKFQAALDYVQTMVGEGKTIVIVGTKTQFKKAVKAVALETGAGPRVSAAASPPSAPAIPTKTERPTASRAPWILLPKGVIAT